MRVIPEDHPSKLPPETLFEQASPEDLPEPFRKMTRVPERPLPFFRAFRSLRRSPAECLLWKLPPKPLPARLSEIATYPGSHPGTNFSETLLRHASGPDPSIFLPKLPTGPEGN